MKINENVKIGETNKTLNDLVNSSYDSGWIYPTLNSGWTSQYSGAPTRYRKIGKVVYLESFVDGTSTASDILFTLPEGFRPLNQYTRYVAYSAYSNYIINILNNGKVSVLNKSGAITWLSINHSFIAN